MSWNLFVQDWGDYKSLDEIPDDFSPKSIGKRTEIIQQIQEAEPTADFTDPSWGTLENDNFSIEFNMGNNEISNGFVMHVRGNEMVHSCIGNILEALNLKATDGSTPYFFDIDKSKENLSQWIAYRNQLLKK
ncbi:MAG: hypothetical protein AAFX55_15025 [Bacteroidota bacterium]